MASGLPRVEIDRIKKMKRFVIYNSTGEIIGRIQLGDASQIINYPEAVEVDGEDFASVPEEWAEVDKDRKTLHPKPGKIDPTGKGRKVKGNQ